MAKKPIDPFAQRLVDFLDEIHLPHSELRFRGGSNKNVFDIHHRLDSRKGQFYYELTGWVSRRLLTLWTFPMLSIPNDRLTAAAEYTSRANREEWFGHFEVEYAADGRIGYRTTLLSETAEPGFAVLRDWLDTNWGTISLHTPFIQSVLFDNVSPTDALQALHDDLHKEA